MLTVLCHIGFNNNMFIIYKMKLSGKKKLGLFICTFIVLILIIYFFKKKPSQSPENPSSSPENPPVSPENPPVSPNIILVNCYGFQM